MPTNEENNTREPSLDIDEMLASFSQHRSSEPLENDDHRKAPRYRVKWNVDIHLDNKVAYQGFINDISVAGASICMNASFKTNRCTLHIHIPPLNLTSKPRIIEVSGKLVYVVYDGNQQLFRAAISFLKFNPESDFAFLKERLTRHHAKIPESSTPYINH